MYTVCLPLITSFIKFILFFFFFPLESPGTNSTTEKDSSAKKSSADRSQTQNAATGGFTT